MTRARTEKEPPVVHPVRCAIYTRKSSEEGLEQEFNSLDAQRESAEAYVASQKAEGWVALPDRYDDGGYSGGNMDRPALDSLLDDIDAGKIDCVVVYKVDRLSRSLLDFARIMETFERHNVAFVSVTQHFNTSTSMGRLILNVLLSFAQFEREIIGERIRDKIAAQRRKGKWAGGVPVLGYDVDRSGPSPRLVINAEEAARVRQIFNLYLDRGSLMPVVHDLARRKWRNKKRTTIRGKAVGDRPFDKATVYALLTNPIYIGKVIYKKEVYDGEHEPIITPEVFARVRDLLQRNGRTGCAEIRNRYGALLRRLLYCKICGHAMVHTFTSTRGKRGQQYRYYTGATSMKSGQATCPCGSLPATEIERVVLDQVRCIAQDPELLAEVLDEARAGITGEINLLRVERGDIERELARHHSEIRKLAISGATDSGTTARIADLHERIRRGERRTVELDAKIAELQREQVDDKEVAAAFADFDGIWSRLSPREQTRVLSLLVARVEYDAVEGMVSVTFHASGIKALTESQTEEAA